MKINKDELIKRAKSAVKNAYTPYSKFQVGAAIQLSDGNYIAGSNVENASYGLCSCAERNTLFTAYNLGYRKDDIIALIVYSELDKLISPCGACRQVFDELLHPNTKIILAYGKDKIKTYETTVKALLPLSFTGESLE